LPPPFDGQRVETCRVSKTTVYDDWPDRAEERGRVETKRVIVGERRRVPRS